MTKINLFEKAVLAALKDGAIVLDAGCGDGEFCITHKLRDRAGKIVGVDVDSRALARNPNVDERVIASVEEIPLEDNYFDLVISRGLIEHLENPQAAISEFARVLKPGGRAVILTYNIYSPVMFTSAILPLGPRKWLKGKTIENPEDTYPTHYYCNSKRKMTSAARHYGLEIEDFVRYGDRPGFWKFGFLNFFFVSFDRLTDLGFLNFLKPELLVTFRKGQAVSEAVTEQSLRQRE